MLCNERTSVFYRRRAVIRTPRRVWSFVLSRRPAAYLRFVFWFFIYLPGLGSSVESGFLTWRFCFYGSLVLFDGAGLRVFIFCPYRSVSRLLPERASEAATKSIPCGAPH
jgi:hypothetical protein